MKKTSIMRKLYNSRAFWLIIALLASLSLWIYVISQETEEYKQTFRGVKVELVGEDTFKGFGTAAATKSALYPNTDFDKY